MHYNQYLIELFATGVVIIVLFFLRFVITKMVRRYSQNIHSIEQRTNLIIKYINILLNILVTIALIAIWGVEKKDIFLMFSSVATIIGVAMFAQWSILSNVTSGIILFFFFPFKIGDIIKIHDKGFPLEAEIENISAFHVTLITIDGERVTYPNNLLLQKGISIISRNYEEKNFMD